jgi:hypothetical protein
MLEQSSNAGHHCATGTRPIRRRPFPLSPPESHGPPSPDSGQVQCRVTPAPFLKPFLGLTRLPWTAQKTSFPKAGEVRQGFNIAFTLVLLLERGRFISGSLRSSFRHRASGDRPDHGLKAGRTTVISHFGVVRSVCNNTLTSQTQKPHAPSWRLCIGTSPPWMMKKTMLTPCCDHTNCLASM